MKFAFIAKHRSDLAGGMAMRGAGCLAVGLPCLAEPVAQRQIPQRRDARPAGQGELRCQRPDLWRPPGLARRAGRRASPAACTGSSG